MDVTPRDRPVLQRATARVLLLDERGHLLLLHDSDPGLPRDHAGYHWWLTPGGGVDPGEDVTAAAVRELAEETGLAVTADDVVGPVAHQHVRHGYTDKITDQDDTYVLVRTRNFEIDTAGFTTDEQASVLGHHWWTREELAATAETVWPVALPAILAAADDPSRWPLWLDETEESSVPL